MGQECLINFDVVVASGERLPGYTVRRLPQSTEWAGFLDILRDSIMTKDSVDVIFTSITPLP